MADDTLNLPVGATVQLQLTLPEDSPRELVRVIGYLPGASLVVSTPSKNGNVRIVREGQTYKVRMLHGDSVVGFESKVLFVSLKPYPHLHLQYPTKFEQIMVRNSARVKAGLACKVRNTAQPDNPENFQDATIVDLSDSGARVACALPLGSPGEMLQLEFRLELLGREETLTLIGLIRNHHERLDSTAQAKRMLQLYGVQFKALNRFQQVLLHSWVMEQIVTGTSDMG